MILRCIHASADFDYAGNLCFTPDAVARGLAALRAGTTVVTDTNMALAGLSKPGLERLGASARCFMAEEEIARAARERGTTRAAAAFAYAAESCPGAILAVGNAPTALFTIAEQIEQGLRPALIVAAPVGFVNGSASGRPALRIRSPVSPPWGARAAAASPRRSSTP